ncbi:MAG TPA: hypothetical protein VME20_10475 [Acidimicrobiales bacterium]|nr:hypothetical protein [Acidimicrobiales bacterium]
MRSFKKLGSLFRSSEPVAAVGTYTTWSWPGTKSGFSAVQWELEPQTDPSPVGYFWSHQVAIIGGEAAYFGLQTCGSEPTGKIAIFSVWGAVDADGPEYAAPFRGEGSGMSVRVRYPWSPGRRERLTIYNQERGWWAATVGERPVGRIRVAPSWAGLAATSIMWTERYSPPLRSCSELGHSLAWFGTPLADGAEAPVSHQNSLANHRGCEGSSARDAGGGVLHEIGRPS